VCVEDESDGFGMTQGRVIYNRIFFLGELIFYKPQNL